MDYVYSHDKLIDQTTGEFDWSFIKKHARTRAIREFAATNPPPRYIRHELGYLTDIAAGLRASWRRAHGLPDDTQYVEMVIPSWGASGDSFSGRT